MVTLYFIGTVLKYCIAKAETMPTFTGSATATATVLFSLPSSVTADSGLDEEAAEEFLLLDARSVEQPESYAKDI